MDGPGMHKRLLRGLRDAEDAPGIMHMLCRKRKSNPFDACEQSCPTAKKSAGLHAITTTTTLFVLPIEVRLMIYEHLLLAPLCYGYDDGTPTVEVVLQERSCSRRSAGRKTHFELTRAERGIVVNRGLKGECHLESTLHTYAAHAPSYWHDGRTAAPISSFICAQILSTCHQIHDEACTILYGRNRFSFLDRTVALGAFLSDLQPLAKSCIRSLALGQIELSWFGAAQSLSWNEHSLRVEEGDVEDSMDSWESLWSSSEDEGDDDHVSGKETVLVPLHEYRARCRHKTWYERDWLGSVAMLNVETMVLCPRDGLATSVHPSYGL
ncbi:hypothetical protein MRB53_041186 [Persea americana]|nr:hypothetical protein MRB53_041186 [Persea americana]